MRAPLALAIACATASAVLLLAACGGGSNDSDKIKDVSTGTAPASAPATTTAAAATGPARPAIAFPSDAKDVFEGEHTGDATKDAILADNEGFVRAVDEGLFKGSTSTGALGFYSTGKGLMSSITYIHGAVQKGLTWTGTVRFFDRKATVLGDGTASVTYCSDESKEFPKHRKSGKVDNVPTTSMSYVLYNTHLKKNAQGVWQTDNIISDRGSKQCQP
jgi:hypothetical protein